MTEAQFALLNKEATVIALVGIDGSGKSTLAERLVQRMVARGLDAHVAAGPPIGPLRRVLQDLARARGLSGPSALLSGEVVHLLYAALKWQGFLSAREHFETPNGVVISDRYGVCLTAGAMALKLSNVDLFEEMFGALLPPPDAVIYLDVPAELARSRVLERGEEPNSLEVYQRLRDAYTQLLERTEHTRVDGTQSPELITQQVEELIDGLLPPRPARP